MNAAPTAGSHAASTAEAARGLRRVAGNAVALLGAWVLPRVFTTAAVIVAARVLGTASFGAYGTAAAFAVILSIVSTLGMQPLLIREMARDPAHAARWLRSANLAKIASGAAMLCLLLLAGRLLEYPPAVLAAALLLGLGYAIGSLAENLAAWFQAVERMQVWTQASALYGFVTGALGILLVTKTHSVVWFSAAAVAGQGAALMWLAVRLPRAARSARADRRALVRLLHELWPFAAAFVALTAFAKADVLLLERMRTPAEVGIYTAAHKFIDVVRALAIVAAAAVFPRLSRDRRSAAGPRLVELALLAAVPAAGVLFLARMPIVQLLFGASFGESAPVVAALAAAIPALAISTVAGYVAAAAGAMRQVAALYGLLLMVKLALNVVLVPRHGAQGAGIAMLVAEVLLAGGMLVLLARHSARTGGTVWSHAALAGLVCLVAATIPGAGPAVRAALYLACVASVYAFGGVLAAADRAVLMEAMRGARIGIGRQ